MSGWKISFLIALVLPAFSAVASDMDPPGVMDPPEVEISGGKFGEGWYLRGDLSYNAVTDAKAASYRNFDTVGATYSDVAFDSFRFGKGISPNGGVGYKFNEWIRADLTADYFGSNLRANSTSSQPCSTAQAVGTTCSNAYSASYTALGIMANGYLDLGTVVGITPYVGGGIGLYNVDWGTTKNVATCVNGTGACAATDAGSTSSPSTSTWRFAYDLTAGVSYELSENTLLDLSYRYSHIAGGNALNFNAADTAAGATGSKASDNDLTRQEIRAGVRIMFW